MSCRYAVGNDRCQYESYTHSIHVFINVFPKLSELSLCVFEPQYGNRNGYTDDSGISSTYSSQNVNVNVRLACTLAA